MMKMVLRVDLHDDEDKRKAMKSVSTLRGIDSISMDMKERKMTVIGTADLVEVVSKLRKSWQTDIILVGPAKEEEKEAKKKETKKEEEANKDGCEKMKARHEEMIQELLNAYKASPHTTTRYYVQSIEDNPNHCVIC